MGWTRGRWTTARAGRTRDDGERDDGDAIEDANAENTTVERDSELTQGMIDAMNARKARKRRDEGAQQSTGGLEDVNPVALGRKCARRLIKCSSVWRRSRPFRDRVDR